MKTPAKRINITSRIIRPGKPLPSEEYWDKATPEERMNAVWELTRLCLFWKVGDIAESRLNKQITRVIRQFDKPV
jgi:hypothetical protein